MKHKMYKKLASALCLTVTAVNSSIPFNVFRNPLQVMAAIPPEAESATMIDISQIPILGGIKKYSIKQDGKYILTGSNWVESDNESGSGGIYVDVQIIVEEGVTADIYLERLQITNDDGETRQLTSVGCGTYEFVNYTSPLVINGTANIHISDDSTIESVQDLITVNGTMNIIDSGKNDRNEKAVFNLQQVDKSSMVDDYHIANGLGQLNIKGGSIAINTPGYISYYLNPQVIITDGAFVWKGDSDKYSDSIIINGGYVEIEPRLNYGRNPYNSEGEELIGLTIPDFVSGSSIVQINRTSQKDVTVDANGELKAYLRKEKENVIYVGDKAYTYQPGSNELIDIKDSHRLTFIDAETNDLISSYLVREGDTDVLLESDKWNYTFMQNNIKIVEVEPIMKDEVFTVSKEFKQFDVTIDGNETKMEYGIPLEHLYYEKKAEKYIVYYPGDPVTSDLNLTTIPLNVENKYILVQNADDLNEFSKIVNLGCTTLNAKLTDDIVASDTYEPIGQDSSKSYQGIFDGQGHTVTLNINRQNTDYVGFIGVVGDKAVIKNLVIKGQVHGAYATGGIVGASNGTGTITIENCMNYASVTGEGTEGAGIIGTNIESDATLYIKNCANLGDITSLEFTNAISGWAGGNPTIINCYNCGQITNTESEVDPDYSFVYGDSMTIENCYQRNDIYQQNLSGLNNNVTEDQFASGEITFQLNGGNNENTPVWFQTCGQGIPVLNGDPTTQTVYYGYLDCSSDAMGYTNKKHLTSGHQYSYSSTGITIIGQCDYCGEGATATLLLPNTAYDEEPHGAQIVYSEEYKNLNLADLTVKYAKTVDGSYETTMPVAASDWYVRVFVNGNDTSIGEAVSYTIHPAFQAAPIGLSVVDETFAEEHDGQIKNLTTDMEFRYQSSSEEAWTSWEKVTDAMLTAGVMKNLSDGAYEVRYAAKANYQASEAASLTIAAGPVRKYEVTVVNGTGDGSFEEGTQVAITADQAAEGKQFTNWTVVSGAAVTFMDADNSSTSFTMPAGAVEVCANYEDIPTPTPTATPIPASISESPSTLTPTPTRIPGPVQSNESIQVGSEIIRATKLADGVYVDEKGNPIVSSIVTTKWNHQLILDENGKIAKNSIAVMPDGKTYFSGKWGYIVKNKTFVYNNTTYFSRADGCIVTNELVITSWNHLFYADSTGAIAKSRMLILEDGARYFASKSGVIYQNRFFTTYSGGKYYATPSGKIAVSTMITRSNGDQYYATRSGLLAKNRWITYEGKKYYCDKYGKVRKEK